MNLKEIQEQLEAENLDGWLLYDHHVRDPIAYRVLGLELPGHVSRRWYCWLPAEGDPIKLAHRVEPKMIDAAPGEKRLYSGWQEQRGALAEILSGAKRVAMQYSPDCMIPAISLVDAGTIDFVRGLGIEVVSSASLAQYFEARWTAEQAAMHFEAGKRVDRVRREAFDLIGERLGVDAPVNEWEIARFILDRFAEEGMVTASGPAVAVNANSGNPHYGPTAEQSSPIERGDFVLIDLWAKLDRPQSVYYDVTWTGFCGAEPPSAIQNVFDIVTQARDLALQAVDAAVRGGRTIRGFEVDDVTREHIAKSCFGDKFVHRTGHSIGEEVHGNGANIDNLETHDDRPLIANTCFSIEPGVYLDSFGVRSEINCFVSDSGAGATGEVQTEIVRICD